MTPQAPPHPFNSANLSYRAIRDADIAIFRAISDDVHGFQNSNFGNISLPSDTDTKDFMTICADSSKYLLGVVIWLNHPADLSKEKIRELVKKSKDEGKEGLVEDWGIAIGELHLSRLPRGSSHHRWTEVGIDVIPEYQGRGYGKEAILWGLDYAFRRAGLHRVRIRAFEWNEGAIRLYKKIGFKMEGRERQAYWFEGRWWDGIEMGMLEGEWRALTEMIAGRGEKKEE
ncbi:acetyltransferase [Setomelanomma holmii]|uniref:Acetyltransferase n=1 Tax=Setomelanomma holmii TaxID=210430 RepID=A0A9P4H3H6_9PLEO|nr:acetyltransferase [Setomelanomma holmii]